MAKFVKGDVVVVPFSLHGDDVILCQITSQSIKDQYAVPLHEDDFDAGTLKQQSNVRPNRIFTADSQIVLYKIGSLKTQSSLKLRDK